MVDDAANPQQYVEAISQSGLSIYDLIEIDDPELWIPTQELELLLNQALRGISLVGLPLRTRSKVVKEYVCSALGYPVPPSFTKTQPRFPGQFFDTYVQKSNNLQIWNEDVESNRRYVIIRVSEDDVITSIKVVTGATLALLDSTGTLTQKYQARLVPGDDHTELITTEDTNSLRPSVHPNVALRAGSSPTSNPVAGQIFSIGAIFERLETLIGATFADIGHDQERNRGAELHRLVCETLGYEDYRDDGQFPDIRHQLLEVKLQTSPTIDLGLICPDSAEPLNIPSIHGQQIRHCDVRYALFYAQSDGQEVTLTHFFLTTGERFFSRFPQFQGQVVNRKLQIPLPADFFDG